MAGEGRQAVKEGEHVFEHGEHVRIGGVGACGARRRCQDPVCTASVSLGLVARGRVPLAMRLSPRTRDLDRLGKRVDGLILTLVLAIQHGCPRYCSRTSCTHASPPRAHPPLAWCPHRRRRPQAFRVCKGKPGLFPLLTFASASLSSIAAFIVCYSRKYFSRYTRHLSPLIVPSHTGHRESPPTVSAHHLPLPRTSPLHPWPMPSSRPPGPSRAPSPLVVAHLDFQ